MFKVFSKISLVYQLAIMVLVITVTVFSGLTLYVSNKTSSDAIIAVEKQLEREVTLIAGNFELFHKRVVNRADQIGDVFVGLFPGAMKLNTKAGIPVGDYKAAVLFNDGIVLNGNISKPAEFTNLTGGQATIFVRHGDDFLSISTSFRNAKNKPAFGKLLGTTHPGYKNLMAGSSYMGPEVIAGQNYMAKYLPYKDSAGKVIGAFYVGFNYTKSLQVLKDKYSKVKFGETGYLYAISAESGNKRGQLVVHPSLEGKNLVEMKDATGNKIFYKLLESDSGVIHYDWKDSEGTIKDKLVSFKYVNGWNWVMAVGSYTEEFTRESVSLRNSMLAMSMICALLIVMLVFLALRRWLSPLGLIAKAIQALGSGDLRESAELKDYKHIENTDNEIHVLAAHTNKMAKELSSLISGIIVSVETMKGSSEQVAEVSNQTSSSVSKQLGDVDMVATAINEMAATIQEVASSAISTDSAAQESNAYAIEGNKVVNSVSSSIQSLANEVEQSAAVIEKVEKESESIDTVLEVIRGIAEQTNLLALNAAIEAARAGEQGRGFAVVADEVRTLASRTQDSTQEIQEIIERLQSSTKEAVEKMQSGRGKAQSSVEEVAKAGEVLDKISGSIEMITDMTSQIATATEQQSRVAEDVNESVVNIRDISSETAEGANEMMNATNHMQQTTEQLQQATARFIV